MKHQLLILLMVVGSLGLIPPHATLSAPRYDELELHALAWSSDGMLLAVGTNEDVRIFDVSGSAPMLIWLSPSSLPVRSIAFSSDGKWLAVGTRESSVEGGWITVWEWEMGKQIANFQANLYTVFAIAFSPDGARLASGGGYFPTRVHGDYDLQIWDTATWQPAMPSPARGIGGILFITYSPDGQYLVFSRINGSTALLDAKSGVSLTYIHQEDADCVEFSDDSQALALGLYRSAQRWQLRTAPEIHLVRDFMWLDPTTEYNEGEFVIGCSVEHFVTEQTDGTLIIRSMVTGETEYTYPKAGWWFDTAVFSPDGQRVAWIAYSGSSQYSRDKYQLELWAFAADNTPIVIETPLGKP